MCKWLHGHAIIFCTYQYTQANSLHVKSLWTFSRETSSKSESPWKFSREVSLNFSETVIFRWILNVCFFHLNFKLRWIHTVFTWKLSWDLYAYTWRFCLINFQIYVSSQIWLAYKIRYKTWWKHMYMDVFLPVSCCCTAVYVPW